MKALFSIATTGGKQDCATGGLQGPDFHELLIAIPIRETAHAAAQGDI
jgi:hypothetical protein